MAIHDLLARAVAQIKRDWLRSKPDLRLSAIRNVVVVRDHVKRGMSILLLARIILRLVFDALKRRGLDLSLRIDLHFIDPFDISGPAPASHQCARLSTAVLVSKDDAVPNRG